MKLNVVAVLGAVVLVAGCGSSTPTGTSVTSVSTSSVVSSAAPPVVSETRSMQPATPASSSSAAATSDPSVTSTGAATTAVSDDPMKTVADKIGATGYVLSKDHPYSLGYANCTLRGSKVKLFSFSARSQAATVLAMATTSGYPESTWSGNVLIFPQDVSMLPGIVTALA